MQGDTVEDYGLHTDSHPSPTRKVSLYSLKYHLELQNEAY